MEYTIKHVDGTVEKAWVKSARFVVALKGENGWEACSYHKTKAAAEKVQASRKNWDNSLTAVRPIN